MAKKDDDALKAYLEHARTELFPKMKSAALSLTIIGGEPDPKLCLELGAAIMFDKPIIVVGPADAKTPANLRRVATAVVLGDVQDPAFMDQVRARIKEVTENDGRARTMKAGE